MRKSPKRIDILFTLSFVFIIGFVSAQGSKKPFKDTTDNAFDISHYLYDLHGFLPIVSPITEPAVGYGASVAAVYFIPKKDKNIKKFQMPDVVGLAGGYTENTTWFAGAVYAGFWKDDHIRYRGIVGYGDIKLKYYGTGGGFLDQNPIKFSMKTSFVLQQLVFRLGESNFLLGAKYQFSQTDVAFFEDNDIKWLDPSDFSIRNSGIGLISEFETFDNLFSPNKGIKLGLYYDQFAEFLGSDRDNGRFTAYGIYYQQLFPFWKAGFRIESQLATGDPAFYSLPYINLRGVPAMRYQGEFTALLETEQEFSLSARWSLVGFAGYGRAWEVADNSSPYSSAWNAGGGFRYLIARALRLKMGIDVARGPESYAIYIVFGNAWLK